MLKAGMTKIAYSVNTKRCQFVHTTIAPANRSEQARFGLLTARSSLSLCSCAPRAGLLLKQ